MHLKMCIGAVVITLSMITASPYITQIDHLTRLKHEMGVMEKGVHKELSYLYDKENSFKAYMDYRTITDISSKQWNMQSQAYTDDNGMRKIGDYYCIALGSGISNKLGTKFEITLDSGRKFKAILADQKADCHTDPTNTYIPLSNQRINIVEFIVQDDAMPQIVRTMGNIDNMPGGLFSGQIINIKELVN